MNYRREIDGLRALAVMPVILFHAGTSWFAGGFLGVDVFFVISGYLIIGLMIGELGAGKFSLHQFYIRRARRILPALYAVVLATIPFAYVWLLPASYEDYSKSLLSVLVFASNLLFWRESGYFAPDSSEKPLLHTWSLGVEEQFYILMPLCMLLLWRYARPRTGAAMLVIAATGLALCELASRYMPAANFFLLPTRMWELAIGGYVAWWHHRGGARTHEALSLAGLVLMLGAFLGYEEAMRLPSLLTLVPALGAALVLGYGGQGTRVARLLSWSPLVGIGLISYSAYLWHHPILAFARVVGAPLQNAWVVVGFLALTLLLATLSWRFVEQPFRNKKHAAYVSGKKAMYLASFAALLIAVAGIHGVATKGRTESWKKLARPTQVKAYDLLQAARAEPRYVDNGDCVFNVSQLQQTEQDRLTQCAAKYGRGIAVFGDSHAINLFYMMMKSAPQEKFLVGIAQGMCRPHSDASTCYYHDLSHYLEQHRNPFRVMLYTQAGFYLMQDRHGKPIDRNDISGPLDRPWPEIAPNHGFIEAVKQYLETVAAHGTRVIWVGAHVSPHTRIPVVVQMGCDADFYLRPSQAVPYEQLDQAIAEHLKGSGIEFRSQLSLLKFDMQQDFMNCKATYFMDGDHYSQAGEARFAKRVTLRALLE